MGLCVITSNGISIHALREEGDIKPPAGKPAVIRISIHALREEGDCCHVHPPFYQGISIHALREEGDGRRAYDGAVAEYISIHALREEGDRFCGCPWRG